MFKNILKPSKLFCIFSILFFGYSAYNSTLNYLGYCRKENRIFSDDEMIEIAAKAFNNREKIVPHSDNRDRELKIYIPYRSVEELLEKNSECCSFGLTAYSRNVGLEGLPNFWDRIFGSHRGYAGIEPIIEYQENNGDIKSEKHLSIYSMNNCGIIN